MKKTLNGSISRIEITIETSENEKISLLIISKKTE